MGECYRHVYRYLLILLKFNLLDQAPTVNLPATLHIDRELRFSHQNKRTRRHYQGPGCSISFTLKSTVLHVFISHHLQRWYICSIYLLTLYITMGGRCHTRPRFSCMEYLTITMISNWKRNNSSIYYQYVMYIQLHIAYITMLKFTSSSLSLKRGRKEYVDK